LPAFTRAQSQQSAPPSHPEGATPPAQPAPEPPLPGQAASAAPDQANPATYPAPADGSRSDPDALSSQRRDLTSPRGDAAAQGHATSKTTAPANQSSWRLAAAAGISAGMEVQSSEGHRVGTVADIVSDSGGRPAYIVIADGNGADRAIPYELARSMVHGGRFVVDEGLLRGAPRVQGDQLQNPANHDWRRAADDYWQGRRTSGG